MSSLPTASLVSSEVFDIRRQLVKRCLPILGTGLLMLWLSGGLPPLAWRLLLQILLHSNMLWTERGLALLAPLFILLIQSLALAIAWVWFIRIAVHEFSLLLARQPQTGQVHSTQFLNGFPRAHVATSSQLISQAPVASKFKLPKFGAKPLAHPKDVPPVPNVRSGQAEDVPSPTKELPYEEILENPFQEETEGNQITDFAAVSSASSKPSVPEQERPRQQGTKSNRLARITTTLSEPGIQDSRSSQTHDVSDISSQAKMLPPEDNSENLSQRESRLEQIARLMAAPTAPLSGAPATQVQERLRQQEIEPDQTATRPPVLPVSETAGTTSHESSRQQTPGSNRLARIATTPLTSEKPSLEKERLRQQEIEPDQTAPRPSMSPISETAETTSQESSRQQTPGSNRLARIATTPLTPEKPSLEKEPFDNRAKLATNERIEDTLNEQVRVIPENTTKLHLDPKSDEIVISPPKESPSLPEEDMQPKPASTGKHSSKEEVSSISSEFEALWENDQAEEEEDFPSLYQRRLASSLNEDFELFFDDLPEDETSAQPDAKQEPPLTMHAPLERKQQHPKAAKRLPSPAPQVSFEENTASHSQRGKTKEDPEEEGQHAVEVEEGYFSSLLSEIGFLPRQQTSPQKKISETQERPRQQTSPHQVSKQKPLPQRVPDQSDPFEVKREVLELFDTPDFLVDPFEEQKNTSKKNNISSTSAGNKQVSPVAAPSIRQGQSDNTFDFSDEEKQTNDRSEQEFVFGNPFEGPLPDVFEHDEDLKRSMLEQSQRKFERAPEEAPDRNKKLHKRTPHAKNN